MARAARPSESGGWDALRKHSEYRLIVLELARKPGNVAGITQTSWDLERLLPPS